MKIDLIHEFNSDGHLLYLGNLPGAYVRGRTLDEALQKLPAETESYCRWAALPYDNTLDFEIVQEKLSELRICDADSDVLFDSEKGELSVQEYEYLKKSALKSAKNFLDLYLSVPNKDGSVRKSGKAFYGQVPVTANEMYTHTKNVNEYYFGELDIAATNEPDIYTCRLQGFAELEKQTDFLRNPVFEGSYGEQWSLKKLLRRFIWHDRIHAKAMWRMAEKLFGNIADPFFFKT